MALDAVNGGDLTGVGDPLPVWRTEWRSVRPTSPHRRLAGHRDQISAVAVERFGDRTAVVSIDADRNIRVWDARTGDLVSELPIDAGPNGSVEIVALTLVVTDGRLMVVSGHYDGAIQLWDPAVGLPVADRVAIPLDKMTMLAAARIGNRTVVACDGLDGISGDGTGRRTIRAWDAVTGAGVGRVPTKYTGNQRSVGIERLTARVNATAIGRIRNLTVIATGDSDRLVRLWDAGTGASLGEPLAGHTGAVTAVAFGRIGDRTVVVSGGSDRLVRLWDAGTGASLGEPLAGHTGAVTAVAAGRIGDRTVVVSGGMDRTVRVWDIDPALLVARTAAVASTTGSEHVLAGHTSSVEAVAIGAVDGRTVVVSAGGDKRVRIWDAGTGASVGKPLSGHTGQVRSVAIGSVGERAVIVSGANRKVHVWDAATGRRTHTLTGHTKDVYAVAIGPVDHRTLVVSAGRDGVIRRWDAATGEPFGEPMTGHPGIIWAVALGQVGDRVVIASCGGTTRDETVRLWDAATGEPVGEPIDHPTGAVGAVALGRIGDRAVLVTADGQDDRVWVWDPATGTPIRSLTGHTARVSAVAIGDHDGRCVVVSSGIDATVRIWDAATGESIGDPLTGHTGHVDAVAVGSLGDRLCVASGGQDWTLRIWKPAVHHPLTGHTDWVNAVAVGQVDGRTVVVSGGADRAVRMRDAVTGAPLGRPLGPMFDWVNAVAVGQVEDRVVVAFGGGVEGTVWVWDIMTGKSTYSLDRHAERVTALAFGAVGGRPIFVTGGQDGAIQIWSAATGRPIGGAIRRPLTGPDEWPSAVAVGQLGSKTVIVSAHGDALVVRDAESRKRIRTLTGHTRRITTVAIGSVNGRTVIASAGHDAAIRVWDAATGEPVGDPLLGHTDCVRSVAIGSVGVSGRPVILSGGHDGTVRIWDVLHRSATVIAFDTPVVGIAETGPTRLAVATTTGIHGLARAE